MSKDIIFRKAEEKDIDIVIEAILESERSHSNTIGICNVFQLSKEDIIPILKNIVLEDSEGHELSLHSYIIAEKDGIPLGASAAWIESKDDIPSSIIKANLLSYYMPKSNYEKAQEIQPLISKLHFPRERMTIQHEHVYARPEFRTAAVSLNLILAQDNLLIQDNPEIIKAQGQIAMSNELFVRVIRRIGYFQKESIEIDEPEILKYLPTNGRILVEKDFTGNYITEYKSQSIKINK